MATYEDYLSWVKDEELARWLADDDERDKGWDELVDDLRRVERQVREACIIVDRLLPALERETAPFCSQLNSARRLRSALQEAHTEAVLAAWDETRGDDD